MKTRGLSSIISILVLGAAAAALYACSSSDTPAATKKKDAGPVAAAGDTGAAGDTTGAGGDTNAAGDTNTGGDTTGVGGSTDTAGSTGGGLEPVWAVAATDVVCAGNPTPPAVAKWVDDFEGGSNVFDPVLVAGWAVYSDTEETITGGTGAASSTSITAWGSHDPASTYGMEMRGWISANPVAGKNSWGAGWQFMTEAVNSEGGARAVMDVTAYTGLVLWARLAGAPGKGNMIVAFSTPATTILESGGDGTCGNDSGAYASCYADYQAPAKITKTCWGSIQIPFSTLKVPYGTTPAVGFVKSKLFGLTFSFSAWATLIKANWPVDVIVDDVYFY
jgi:hypothetical protein